MAPQSGSRGRERCCSAHFLLFIHSETPAQGMTPSTVGKGFSHLSELNLETPAHVQRFGF